MAKQSEKQPKEPKQPKLKKPTTTYQYRIYPTQKQMRILGRWLGFCCEVYNAALDERKSAYRMAGISLSYTHQCAELPGCKEVRLELVVDVLRAPARQSGRGWSRSGAGESGIHEPNLFGVRASPTDAAICAGLRMPPLWSRDPPRPQWEQEYLT